MNIIAGDLPASRGFEHKKGASCLSGQSCSLSSIQQSFWFLYQLHPERQGSSNLALCIRIFEPLHVSRLSKALNQLAARHPMLRARFFESDGELRQAIEPDVDVPLAEVDARNLDKDNVRRRVAYDYAQAFDLTRAPLMRAHLYRIAQEQSVFLLVFDHLICDAWSLWRLIEELGRLIKDGDAVQLTHKAGNENTYFDYVRAQKLWLDGAGGQKQLAYWKDALAGDYPTLKLLQAKPAALEQPISRQSCYWVLGPVLTQKVKELALTHKTTAYVVLLSAYFILWHRLTGEDKISIGSPMPGRNGPQWHPVTGNFFNLAALRAEFEPQLRVKTLLGKVHSVVKRGLVNQNYPFAELVDQMAPQRMPDQHPFFQTLFSYQNPRDAAHIARLIAGDHEGPRLSWGGLEVAQFWRAPTDGAKGYDLALDMIELEFSIIGVFNYAAARLAASVIENIMGMLQKILEGMTTDPEALTGKLPLFSSSACREVLKKSQPEFEEHWGDHNVDEMVEVQAAQRPQKIALSYKSSHLTYAEVNARANRLAHHLRALGAGPETLVGICAEPGVETIIALLAIWKSGGAYLPLDPAYPAARLQFMLEDSAPLIVLTAHGLGSKAFTAALPGSRCKPIEIDLDGTWPDYPTTKPPANGPALHGKNLAYVLYTSGSTGRPKGVMVEHGNLVNLLCSMRALTRISSHDRMLALTSLGFDIAGLELWLPLICGAEVVIAGAEARTDPEILSSILGQHHVTFMQATPATWRMLLNWGWRGLPGLKALCGGEALSVGLAAEINERVQCLWNLYGPTETTIWSSAWLVSKGCLDDTSVPIGLPLANTSIYVLDSFGELVPDGVKGEIWIGGAGVARGYLKRPDLTSERFLACPFTRINPAARIYRTGDLGWRGSDGTLHFLGRADTQIKLRGYRVETGEIEAYLLKHPSVRESVVAAKPDGRGDVLLAAFYTLKSKAAANPQRIDTELRSHLRAALPDYMIPAQFKKVENLPLTASGKLDRLALLNMSVEADNDSSDPHDPPAAGIESEVARIWADVLKLNISQIGRHDDFFELGGHSLALTAVVSKLRTTIGVVMPVSAVFATPRLSALAARIESAKAGPIHAQPFDHPRIVSFNRRINQPPSKRPAIFAIGEPITFRPLALCLANEGVPLYAIWPQETDMASLLAFQTVEEIAEFHLRALKSAQPEGPYVLLGFCATSPIAFQMAHHLGASAALVIIVDAWAPGEIERLGLIKWFFMWLSYNFRVRLWFIRHWLKSSDVDLLSTLFEMLPAKVREQIEKAANKQASPAENLVNHYAAAANQYCPETYERPVLVIRSEIQPQWKNTLSALGWNRFAKGETKSAVAPGYHIHMFAQANVKALARLILASEHLKL